MLGTGNMSNNQRKTLLREPSALAGRHKLDSGDFMGEERQKSGLLRN